MHFESIAGLGAVVRLRAYVPTGRFAVCSWTSLSADRRTGAARGERDTGAACGRARPAGPAEARGSRAAVADGAESVRPLPALLH